MVKWLRFPFRSKNRLASLSRIANYRHKEVVLRFCEHHAISLEEGELLFAETKKFLWLMGYYRLENAKEFGSQKQGVAVYWPMRALDEMWHEFILFTEDYSEFCERYLGSYLHHSPMPSSQKNRHREFLEKKIQQVPSDLESEWQETCRFVAKRLGGDTLRLWFSDFPKRFPQFSA